MDAMTNACLVGRFTSLSQMLTGITIELEYRGHAMRHGKKVRMQDFAMQEVKREYSTPTILLVGTSMSAGKTTAGKLACKVLSESGLERDRREAYGRRDAIGTSSHSRSPVPAPYTTSWMSDCRRPLFSEKEFRSAVRPLLSHIQSLNADVVVVEAGASPLEPYNGAAAIDELNDSICCTILCASDPYSVVGVQNAFGLKPDLVSGPATNTSAGIALVQEADRRAPGSMSSIPAQRTSSGSSCWEN